MSAQLTVTVTTVHPGASVPRGRLREAVQSVLREAGFRSAKISVAVVDDPTIAALNERFLKHQGATDVLSFALEEGPGRLEGEIVVSYDTAARSAAELGWPTDDELLLYVIHGALHLAGFDDHDPLDRRAMRSAEARHLAAFGLVPPPTPAEPSVAAGSSRPPASRPPRRRRPRSGRSASPGRRQARRRAAAVSFRHLRRFSVRRVTRTQTAARSAGFPAEPVP